MRRDFIPFVSAMFVHLDGAFHNFLGFLRASLNKRMVDILILEEGEIMFEPRAVG